MKKMSRWGVGPVFAILSVIFGIIVISLSMQFRAFFRITVTNYMILETAGIILIVIGVPFFIASAIGVSKAYNADKLITGGVYRCCRHPLYASWVVFIVPGIILLLNTWLGLILPIIMYVLLFILVKKEEEYLAERFGIVYRDYKNKIPCILPYGLFKKI